MAGKGCGVSPETVSPLGGIHDQTAEIFREPVAPGDMILMISDGILDTGVNRDEMEYWLTRTFAESAGEEARIVAERLLNGALAFPKDPRGMI